MESSPFAFPEAFGDHKCANPTSDKCAQHSTYPRYRHHGGTSLAESRRLLGMETYATAIDVLSKYVFGIASHVVLCAQLNSDSIQWILGTLLKPTTNSRPRYAGGDDSSNTDVRQNQNCQNPSSFHMALTSRASA
jgi:hypothetical protein